MFRIATVLVLALLSLSSIAEAGEAPAGRVKGLRIKFESGWVYECQAPSQWYSWEAEIWPRLAGGTATTRDVVNGDHGQEWVLTLTPKDWDGDHRGEVPLIVRPHYKMSDLGDVPALDFPLCESPEKSRIAAWGRISKDRFESSGIEAADVVWMDPF